MKLSVIVPCYNVENEVERCVRSISKQGIESIEIILVNDGSTDSTPMLVDQLSEKYSIVKTIHKENGGLSDARNVGIDHATGEYIAFVDSDDYLTKNIYTKIFKKMEEKKADLGIFNIDRVFSNKTITQDSISTYYDNSNDILEAMFRLNGVNFYAWNKVMKRSIINNLYFEKDVMYEDIMFSYNLSNRSNSAVITDEVGYNYIDNEDSIVNQTFNPKQYDNVTERLKLYESVLETNKELEPLALNKLVDGFLSTGYKIASANHNENIKFVNKLRSQIKEYKNKIKKSSDIIFLKKVGLFLLMNNLSIYRLLYKLYLRK